MAVALAWNSPAQAQGAEENVVSAADDAFGMTAGNETVGVYNAELVRGFSPVVAGNIRIEGLYFDLAGELNKRLVNGSNIRVGLTAQTYPFPAPTGIVDYTLRTTDDQRGISTVVGLDDYNGPYVELDLQLPIQGQRVGLAAGISRKNENYADGSDTRVTSGSLVLTWRPSQDVSLTTFWSWLDGRDAEAQPVITLAGPILPPKLPRRTFYGQQWTANDYSSENSGLIGSFAAGSNWVIRAGVFRSKRVDESEFTDAFRNMQGDGTARHVIIADPRKDTVSTSGEFRVTRLVSEGPRIHALRAIFRARDRRARYGGSAMVDFGSARVDQAIELPKPMLAFSEQALDRVRQITGGIAYENVWKQVGALSLGIQKTSYDKSVDLTGQPAARTSAKPWLFYVNAAVRPASHFDLFAGYTRGLEETGVAPESASNRGAALPTARTRQSEVGLRYALTRNLTLIAGAFDVRKPYFNLASDNVFTNLGEVRHRGIELSLAGSVAPGLKVIAGAVLLRARVSGDAIKLGRVGRIPINSSPLRVRSNLEYAWPAIEGLSVDCGIEMDGKRMASRDNRLRLPARILFKGGARYRFHVGHSSAQLRLFVENLADSYAWKISNSGGFRISAGRRLTGYVAFDL